MNTGCMATQEFNPFGFDMFNFLCLPTFEY